jgi:hypothetical protein
MENEGKRITLRIPADVDEELERWRKAYEQQTGMRISKNSAIVYLMKQGVEASHG